MIFILISLLSTILINGPEQIFMATDIVKEIKHNVKDNNRKTYVLKIMKEAKSEIKAYQKNYEKNEKKVKKLLNKDLVSLNDIEIIVDKNLVTRKKLQRYMVASRLLVQDSLTDNEWVLILEKSNTISAKKKKKQLKKHKKDVEKLKEFVIAFKDEINKTRATPTAKEKIISTFDAFIEDYKNQLKVAQELSFSKSKTLNNKYAPQAELIDIYTQQNNVRTQVRNSFYKLFEITQENTSEREWVQIRKELKTLFK